MLRICKTLPIMWPLWTFGATTLGIMTLSITIKSDTQHNDTQYNGTWHSILLCWVSFTLSVYFAECHKQILMLSVVMLNVVMLSVVAPNSLLNLNQYSLLSWQSRLDSNPWTFQFLVNCFTTALLQLYWLPLFAKALGLFNWIHFGVSLLDDQKCSKKCRVYNFKLLWLTFEAVCCLHCPSPYLGLVGFSKCFCCPII
jgi:hypothetical protein